MNFEDKKVFVGNLPLFTKEDEVVDILRGFTTNLSITEIFVWKNRNTPTNVQTEAAFVTLQTNEIRDELIRNYRLKYPDRSIRLPFRNRYGNETNIYITLCYIKPDKRHKDPKPFQRTKETAKAPNFPQPKHTNNKACKQDELTQVNRQQEINLSEENEQLVETKVKLEEQVVVSQPSALEKLKSEIQKERTQLLEKIDTLEASLKSNCSGFFMSLKELSLLQSEFEQLSVSLAKKREDLKTKKTEFTEIYDLYEQLNSSII